MEEAEKAKLEGNAHFKAGKLNKAVGAFTRAIELASHPEKSYHSNRSAVLCKLRRLEEALADAEICIELDPTWHKGYIRRGDVQMGLEDFDAALASFQ